MVIIFAMFAGQTDVILEHVGPLTAVCVPVVLFFLINFALAYALSWISRLRYKEYALLTCTAVARNSPMGLAIVFGPFPDQPLVQVAIIIGVIIELPILVALVRLLRFVGVRFPLPSERFSADEVPSCREDRGENPLFILNSERAVHKEIL